ncbi:MAG: phosphate acyltransferase PlsX, partial [Alphaproteobacteria bacterium]|nr:phosphate acyltransferase PlsX [Alphaproteobacteria bacterium]
MTAAFTLAIDAMGGDRAPEMVVDGMEIAAERHPAAKFLLVGDQARLGALLAGHKRAVRACTLRHAPEVIGNDMKPSAAVRARLSSMRVAIDAVAEGDAAGVVTAGNTGALLALAKIVLKTMPGIDRPAMAAAGPSAHGDVVMLDLGANLTCDARNLVEFAVMGDVFARTVLGLPAPTIGLLNVGSEEQKGVERIRQAADILRDSHIGPQFKGFVEGHDIAAGTADVVVTDGFTGNVALKTAEGALKLISGLLRQVFTSSL